MKVLAVAWLPAAPFFFAVVLAVLSPVFTQHVRQIVIGHFQRVIKNPRTIASKPPALADVVEWGIDGYEALIIPWVSVAGVIATLDTAETWVVVLAIGLILLGVAGAMAVLNAKDPHKYLRGPWRQKPHGLFSKRPLRHYSPVNLAAIVVNLTSALVVLFAATESTSASGV